jgi:hypothetical protein
MKKAKMFVSNAKELSRTSFLFLVTIITVKDVSVNPS